MCLFVCFFMQVAMALSEQTHSPLPDSIPFQFSSLIASDCCKKTTNVLVFSNVSIFFYALPLNHVSPGLINSVELHPALMFDFQ